ncbi:hypothetical protein BUALT_Bualt17G0062600 [Buddleja alternifolia]|uniref:Retrotransposon Copia-like N-terminal domain-containing protein n=1 Tax=Buddleja alternifolia TaxID=168488 RepID=A0AAV6W769_9LAMI|nr:hypothetical protein BUALT_Bualt17G0062600 [Buddleja alternifolia]
MANGGNKSDSGDAYSLHHSDHPRMVLVSKPHEGDNYSTWRRAMVISLNAKSKLGFVDGTLKAPSATTKPEDYTIEAAAMVIQKNEPVALAVRHKSGSYSRLNSSNRKPLHCSHCNRDNHVRETCWKLNGYPPGHPKHASAKNTQSKHNNNNQSSVNNVREAPLMQQNQSVINGLTELQLQQILTIMQGTGPSSSVTPKANNANTSSGLSPPELIIDSGATDHITSSPALLVNSKQNTSLPPVVMPNGDQAPIISTGSLPLNHITPEASLSIEPTPVKSTPSASGTSPPAAPLRRSQRSHVPPPTLRDYICNQVTSPEPLSLSSSCPHKVAGL